MPEHETNQLATFSIQVFRMKTMWRSVPNQRSAISFCPEYNSHHQGGVCNMMSVETMRSVNPKTVDRSTLVQRDSIRLEPAAAQDDRLRDFIRQIRNPYCYLDGKTVVKISFSKTDTTLEDCLEHYLRGL